MKVLYFPCLSWYYTFWMSNGWMTSRTRWTWVWVNSGRWWWTGRPGVLRFMGSQRVGHDWATELNWMVSHLGECSSIQLMLSHVQFSYASLARILQKGCAFLSALNQCTNKTGCVLRLVMLPWKSAGFLYCNASPSLFVINTLGEMLLEWYSVSHQNLAHWF